MGWFLVNWLTTGLALGAVAWILPGVTIVSLPALAVAAIVLGIVNAVIKPVLVVLTLPLTVMTLGVFYLIVNGVAFALAAWIVPGFEVRSLWWAMLGAGARRPGIDVDRGLPAAAAPHADRRHRRHRASRLTRRATTRPGAGAARCRPPTASSGSSRRSPRWG